MSNYGAMQNRIADDIVRTDLTTQIRESIQTAISDYEHERFWFNEERAQLTTSSSQAFYTAPADLMEIDVMTVTVSNRRYPLNFRDWYYIEDIDTGVTYVGVPEDFAVYRQEIRLFPTPNQQYTLTLSYLKDLSTLTISINTNAWMVEGEHLIRAAAKRLLYTHVIIDKDMAGLIATAEMDALRRLKSRTEKYISTGRLRPTVF